MSYFTVYEIADNMYHIWEPAGVASTLVVGASSALLVDTGYGFEDLKAVVKRLTPLPFRVLNTHCHLDHAGGNFLFSEDVFAHPYEQKVYDIYQKEQKPMIMEKFLRENDAHTRPWPDMMDINDYLSYKPCEFLPLRDGEIIDLGDRKLDVLFLPGHTRGSVVIFDRQTGILLSGDNISDSLWIQFPQSEPVLDYADHLEKLRDFPVRKIFSSHSKTPWETKLIEVLQSAIRHISPEKSRVFIHPRTGVKSKLFRYPVSGMANVSKIYIVYDPDRMRAG